MDYALVMAGGIGARFWPESRQARPKQFLPLFGSETLLQATVGRLMGLLPPERVLVIGSSAHEALLRDQLPQLPPENVLLEPQSRNTAPCIAYAALHLARRDPEARMLVLPADHLIGDVAALQRVLRVALEVTAEPEALVTIGVRPTRPETGYGYIQFQEPPLRWVGEQPVYRVRSFAEKPNLPTAERFLASGDFLWNSGLFAWRVDSILGALRRWAPDVLAPLEALGEDLAAPEALRRAYGLVPKISIDYAVMEKAETVYVLPAEFGWSDVGSWMAVYELSEKDAHGNALRGPVVALETSHCLVRAQGRLVVLIGLHEVAVIDTPDALLICRLSKSQQVKEAVDHLQLRNMREYL
ncbi:MAG: mannose-1-phosphate guanylyltransferase [Bacteroidota bacterium]|nr:sugar phosphate nucleotidyltransferase [Rhodothermia bacterium]MDW8286420.1 mannose-1-phosphate guanylyltransferase [Bacteroidota bacterium]